MENSQNTLPKNLYARNMAMGSAYASIENCPTPPCSESQRVNPLMYVSDTEAEEQRDRQREGSTVTMVTCTESQLSRRKSASFRPIICLCFISILSILMAAAACGLLVKLWYKCEELERKLSNTQVVSSALKEEPTLCLPCGDLAQGPFEEENPLLSKLIQRQEGDILVCCAKTSTQTSVLLNLYASRKQLEKCAEAIAHQNDTANCNMTAVHNITAPISGQIVSAHILADQQKDPGDSEEQPIRDWVTTDSTTHLTGIELVKGRLIVPKTGLYFLYSQIHFLIYDSDDEERQALGHRLYRYNARLPQDGNEELLRSTTSQFEDKDKDYAHYTSYIAAAIRLTKGDQLYVQVSKISALIAYTPHKNNYFGLYRLSD